MNARNKYLTKIPLCALVALAILVLLSGCQSFGTPPRYPFMEVARSDNPRIAIIGDTQRTSNWEFWFSLNYEKTLAMFREIARRDPAMILHCGDMTARGASEKHWNWFDEATSPVRSRNIPICPALGNHEYYGSNKSAFENLRARFTYFEKKTWYEVTHDGVGCLMLNSQLAELTPEENSEQLQWFRDTLKRMDEDPAIRWIVAVWHKPPYTNGKIMPAGKDMREQYVPPFLASKKAAILFCGHCHSYERFSIQGKTFIVTGGGGGPLHGVSPNGDPPDQFTGPPERFFHFCMMTIEPKSLGLEIVRLNDDGGFDIAEKVAVPVPQ